MSNVAKSKKFDVVKEYYDDGLWEKVNVHNAVGKGWITATEYEKITGEPYEQGEID